jgi:hypothetical protein
LLPAWENYAGFWKRLQGGKKKDDAPGRWDKPFCAPSINMRGKIPPLLLL